MVGIRSYNVLRACVVVEGAGCLMSTLEGISMQQVE